MNAAAAPLTVLGLTRYGRNGPSSRYRFFQFQPALAEQGIRLDLCPLLEDWYLDYLSGDASLRPNRVFASYLRRLRQMQGLRRYDLVWVEKEMLPWVPFLVESAFWGTVPVIVDLDDNHFLRYEQHKSATVRRLLGGKMAKIVSAAAGITCGSLYLAEVARAKGADNVSHIPTVVDIDRYPAQPRATGNQALTIGWIGTPANTRYLDVLREPLATLAAERNLRIVLVGAQKDALPGLPVEIRPWSEAGEIADLDSMDIGIMPLPDAPFERGKCGLKLIQYMAAWKPTIASPVGANPAIVIDGCSGFLANSEAEWLHALRRLAADADLRLAMGRAGRARVVDAFDIRAVLGRLADFLRLAAAASRIDYTAHIEPVQAVAAPLPRL